MNASYGSILFKSFGLRDERIHSLSGHCCSSEMRLQENPQFNTDNFILCFT